MKISIAMATYNGAAYLAEQLDSFVAQSRLPDELIVTDDQSSDGTATILEDFAARAPFPVRVEVNPHRLGVTMNFDKGLGLCTGDLVLLSDQDDVWLPTKIQTLAQTATLNPGKGCFINDAILTDGGLHPVDATKMEQIKAAGLPAAAMVQGCCTAFRRELLDCLLPIPPDQVAHDNWLVQMADLLGQTVRMRDALQYYRRHGGNASDFFVNRLHVPGRWDYLRERIEGMLRRIREPGDLKGELQFHMAAAKRLAEQQARLAAALGEDHVHAVLTRAQSRSRLLARRAALRRLPQRKRLPLVWQLWREQGYAACGGFSSAMKDLLLVRQEPEYLAG